MRIAWIFLLALIVASGTLIQAPGGCTVASADLPATLVEAQQTTHCLAIPVGIYPITQSSGYWLNITTDDMELRGAGVGKTVLQLTGAITLTGSLSIIRTNAARTWIHDLSIVNDATIAAPPNTTMYGVMAHYDPYTGTMRGATYGRFERLDIAGMWGNTAAGGFGVFLGQYPGLHGGWGWHTVRDVTVHDSPDGTGMLIGAHGSTVEDSCVINVGGSSFTKHGLYIQSGYNLIQNNYLERAGAFAIHGYKNAAGMDGSGDRYIGNTIINPGFQAIIATVNALGNRNVTIDGNTIRVTDGHPINGIVSDAPAVIVNNTFEDVRKGGCGAVIRTFGAGTTIANNRIVFPTLRTWENCPGIASEGTNTTITGNVVDAAGLNAGIALSAGTTATGNSITSTATDRAHVGIYVNSSQSAATGNVIDLALGSAFAGPAQAKTTANLVTIAGVVQP